MPSVLRKRPERPILTTTTRKNVAAQSGRAPRMPAETKALTPGMQPPTSVATLQDKEDETSGIAERAKLRRRQSTMMSNSLPPLLHMEDVDESRVMADSQTDSVPRAVNMSLVTPPPPSTPGSPPILKRKILYDDVEAPTRKRPRLSSATTTMAAVLAHLGSGFTDPTIATSTTEALPYKPLVRPWKAALTEQRRFSESANPLYAPDLVNLPSCDGMSMLAHAAAAASTESMLVKLPIAYQESVNSSFTTVSDGSTTLADEEESMTKAAELSATPLADATSSYSTPENSDDLLFEPSGAVRVSQLLQDNCVDRLNVAAPIPGSDQLILPIDSAAIVSRAPAAGGVERLADQLELIAAGPPETVQATSDQDGEKSYNIEPSIENCDQPVSSGQVVTTQSQAPFVLHNPNTTIEPSQSVLDTTEPSPVPHHSPSAIVEEDVLRSDTPTPRVTLSLSPQAAERAVYIVNNPRRGSRVIPTSKTSEFARTPDDHFVADMMVQLERQSKWKVKTVAKEQARRIFEVLAPAKEATVGEALFLTCEEATSNLQTNSFFPGPIFVEGAQPMKLGTVHNFLNEYYDEDAKVWIQDPSILLSRNKPHAREVTIKQLKERFNQRKASIPWNCLELAAHVEDGLRPTFLNSEDCRLLTKLKVPSSDDHTSRRGFDAGYKEIEKWALLAQAGSLTSPHQDSHGYSTYITVNQGVVGFGWLSNPTSAQRRQWLKSPSTFKDGNWRYKILRPGQTVYFPNGTVHFVFRLKSEGDTLAFGGHVLRCSQIVSWVKTLIDERAHRDVTNEDITVSAPGYLERVARFVKQARRMGQEEKWGGAEAIREFPRLKDRFMGMSG